MLTELCQELRNWFDRERFTGTFTITDGSITVPFLIEGQYYRIIGSIFNDGVHKYGDTKDALLSETFTGAIWCLAIPKPVLELADEIAAWRTKYESADSSAMSPFQSESFGGYSYNKGGSTANSGNSAPMSWKSVFASRMNMWRKI